MNYCYNYKGKYVLCFDDARFFNHSDNPNTVNTEGEDGVTIALRDIAPGEEITTNYYEYEDDAPNEKRI